MAGRPGPPGLAPARRDARSTGAWDGVEVVPDSEEERTRDNSNIIEISSDEEESSPRGRGLGDPALQVPGAWPADPNPDPSPPKKVRNIVQTPGTPTSSKKRTIVPTPGTPTSSKKKNVPSTSKRPQIVESTSADAAEDQVVVAQWPTPKSKAPAKHFYANKTPASHTPSPQKSARSVLQLIAAAEDSDSDIEVLSGPTPSPGPTQAKPKLKAKLQPLYDDDDSETSDSSSSEEPSTPDHDSSQDAYGVFNKYAKYWTPSATSSTTTSRKVHTPSRGSPNKSPKKLSLAARMKLEAQERAAHREEYAEQVYSWLNRVVFKDQLPSLKDIEIKWNSRLLTTAGRAQFHRDRHGKEHAEIQLATKVVDCDERIRNTLSHEMCHLACWIIDKQIKESHGKFFHRWARRVEKKDPNIIISVEHTYEISYDFEWQCGDCDQTVGRYTNSIDHTVTKCPWCKTGTLTPLFDPKQPKNAMVSKVSRQAAAKPQSSPRPGPRSVSPVIISIDSSDEEEEEPPASIHVQKEIYVVHDSDSESDQSITDLARKFEGITIAHKVCLHAKRRARH
ncbi:SprT-like family-domain-containing protein [Mycena capillaripes]|nr:SprT-like family-domain-containing protein [Mycena capillaripes]